MTNKFFAFRRFWAGLILAIGLAFSAQAQITEGVRNDYDAWLRTAARAEQVIDAGRASNAAFEELRRELAAYREQFQRSGTSNGERIRTLQGQLDALGPAPAEGETEPEDLAQLRASLHEQLDQLRVPRVVSVEAYSRADGLIAEIDKIIRDRRTTRLLERGPSPLNPEYWPGAVEDLSKASLALLHELETIIARDTTSERTANNLPVIFALTVIGSLLFFRARPWARRAGDYLRQFGARGTGVWTFVVSILQIVLPLIGAIVLTSALELTGILGVRATLYVDYVPVWVLMVLVFHWLGEQLYGPNSEDDLVPVTDGRRRQIRLVIDLLAVVLVLQDALVRMHEIENLSQDTYAVLAFPLITAGALLLLRVQILTRRGIKAQATTEDTGIAAGAGRVISIIRRCAYLLAFLAPVLAAAGYINAAEALIYPAIATLALMATAAVLQRFFSDFYGFLSGKGRQARDSLLAVIVGFVLAILMLPVLALIWGARVADLTELWSTFLAGFDIGGARISPTAFLSFVVIFAIGYTVTRLVQGSLRTSLLPKTSIDPGGQNAIVSGLGYLGIFLSAVIAISMAGLDLSSLAIVAGALSVGIGFGLQTIVSNFVSGIILLIERPISKGDWIEVGGLMGYVRDISVRSTRIETFDRTDVIVPNSDLITGTVTNYTRGNTVGRVIVPVGVAYGTDVRKVEGILTEIAKAHPMVLMNPAPSVVFQGFGADSLDFEIRAILRDVNWVLSVKSEMNYEIARRFDEEGIEIPFAQRDIWIRNPEALAPKDRPAPPPQPVAAASTAKPMQTDLKQTSKPDLSDLENDAGEGDDY